MISDFTSSDLASMPTGSPLGDRRVTAEEHAQEWETLYTNELCPALGTTSINFTV